MSFTKEDYDKYLSLADNGNIESLNIIVQRYLDMVIHALDIIGPNVITTLFHKYGKDVDVSNYLQVAEEAKIDITTAFNICCLLLASIEFLDCLVVDGMTKEAEGKKNE